MENSFQTSFIPKKPVTTTSVPVRSHTSLFSILAVLLLVLVGLASAGFFFYKSYLIKQKEVLSESLAKARASFEKDTIDTLELYDKRVGAAKQVLSGHLVLSPLFALLGELTLPEVQYTKFEHTTTDKGFSVKMSGTARDYRSIALQADAFNGAKGRSFKNVVFSNLTKNKTSGIDFDVEFVVDPALLSYEKNILLEDQQQPVQQTTLPAATVPSGASDQSTTGIVLPQPTTLPTDQSGATQSPPATPTTNSPQQ